MHKCLVCFARSKEKICHNCKKNPFRIEEYRDILSRTRKFELLKSTYSRKYIEIEDLNTANFWDDRLFRIQHLKDQDKMTQDRIRKTVKFLDKKKLRLLDLGTGYGYIEYALKSNPNIIIEGIDISPKAIKNLNRHFNGKFIVNSIYKYKYISDSFDAVVLLEVLEHVPPSKTFFILKNINKVLKRGGIFIVSIPMNEGLEKMSENTNGHLRTYTKDVIFAELKLSGFKIIDYKELYAFKSLYMIKTLLSKVVKNRWRPNNLIIKAEKI